ncbi:hypothetical protein SPHINGO391_380087 [Sphingomonas aurantiaca]|uniref:Uncharacterized protein n=1 Tax=Sphingomonas aurantiaca TaxID=185949 RepID=A0A5E7YIM6_9SPHN|nr:hypothetical protein SPHINGO391_380087 [Sphingomonas aurantiaca]
MSEKSGILPVSDTTIPTDILI